MWDRDGVLRRMVRLILLCECAASVPDLSVIARRLGVCERTARRYLLAYERVTQREVPGWRKARGL